MCMRNTSEGCVLSEQQSALKKEVLSLDERMDKLEKDFATMRSETQDGFRQGAEAMRGNVYAMRMYGRALTDAEAAHNYAVDKARFKLT